MVRSLAYRTFQLRYMLGEGVERNKPKAFEFWQCALANGLEPLYMCQCISNTMVAAARLDAAQSSSSSSQAQALPEKANRVVLGDKVILDGLEKAPELNGRSAVVRLVERFDIEPFSDFSAK